ncbi:hypothetical protein Q604_UNBC07070G0008 [human gut metagenome]|uniref:Glycosyl transferase family 1 domain-containing protein n=1 Tax=human gut metagenome TaxID=408170 RepID=W1Y8U2_9ZZZZ
MVKKSILVVMTSLYNGGAERSLVNLLNEFDTENYEIDLMVFVREGMFESQIPPKINFLNTPSEIQALYTPKLVKMHFKEKIVRLVGTGIAKIFSKTYSERGAKRWKWFYKNIVAENQKKYDVALAFLNDDVMYYIVDKVCADKKIAWVHNDYKKNELDKDIDLPYFRKLDYVATISDECVNILKEVFVEFPEKFICIPNITSSQVIKNRSEEFYPEEYRGKRNILLSIGRLGYQKGFDIAIEAATLLLKRGIDFKWYIIGDGEWEEKLNTLIKEKQLEQNLFLLGIKSNPYPYIKNCDVFVQTSRYEGKSVVIDEAKILAKPIVITNYPTVHDQIQNNEGMIVDITAEGISEGIIMMLEQKEIYNKFLSHIDYGNTQDIMKLYNIIEH